MAERIKKADFESKVIKSDKPVLVDFYADWCGPCQMMAPIIDEITKELDGKASIYKVDVDREHDLANDFQVMSIPTILIFKEGKVSKQFVGAASKSDLIKELQGD